ncbi:MAG: hypothetical protein RMJ96_06450 [Candidatus Bipolaricaulota bacterium]|nr:hypothetical protein [Candidatus Bipolaricaulota bacterium]MDW8329329.1 hypothetical protein [Candidatus Bipolaricaulota bacterium]
MLNGAPTLTLPVSVPPPEFQTVTLAVTACPAKLTIWRLVLASPKAGTVL